MTVTLKARTAAVVLALFCILAGLALGQLTQAESAGSSGGARQLNAIAQKLGETNRQLAAANRQLLAIGKQLGGSSLTSIGDQLSDINSHLGGGSILSIDYRLNQIQNSSSGTCRAVKGFGC
jgi:hypothetical protein